MVDAQQRALSPWRMRPPSRSHHSFVDKRAQCVAVGQLCGAVIAVLPDLLGKRRYLVAHGGIQVLNVAVLSQPAQPDHQSEQRQCPIHQRVVAMPAQLKTQVFVPVDMADGVKADARLVDHLGGGAGSEELGLNALGGGGSIHLIGS
ncbi:hypothetical protein D3C72_1479780 [compost metagenome]